MLKIENRVIEQCWGLATVAMRMTDINISILLSQLTVTYAHRIICMPCLDVLVAMVEYYVRTELRPE